MVPPPSTVTVVPLTSGLVATNRIAYATSGGWPTRRAGSRLTDRARQGYAPVSRRLASRWADWSLGTADRMSLGMGQRLRHGPAAGVRSLAPHGRSVPCQGDGL
jgi:hypothetical protein